MSGVWEGGESQEVDQASFSRDADVHKVSPPAPTMVRTIGLVPGAGNPRVVTRQHCTRHEKLTPSAQDHGWDGGHEEGGVDRS